MASIYQRDNSRFWWIKFVDPESRKTRRTTTGLKVGVGPDTRNAKQLEAEYTLREKKMGPVIGENSWLWVTGFLASRYSPAAQERYLSAWRTLALFLAEKQILSPRQLRRQHCFDYLDWRMKPNKRAGKYRAGRNTSILDLKTLNIIMQEALERGLCDGNPCVKLGIRRDQPKVKPELTTEVIEYIRERIRAIPDEAAREFHHYSFEIARYQGCRLKETSLNPLTDVVIESQKRGRTTVKRGYITLTGKGSREYACELHPELIPLFEDLRARGRDYTWRAPIPSARSWASSRWFKFFRRIGLKQKIAGACFH